MMQESTERLETLRKRISDNTMIYCGNKIKVTVTIGLTFCEDGKTLDEIIKEATGAKKSEIEKIRKEMQLINH